MARQAHQGAQAGFGQHGRVPFIGRLRRPDTRHDSSPPLGSYNPCGSMAKMASTLVGPLRFLFGAYSRRCLGKRLDCSMYSTASTMCSSVRGPATPPLLLTCATRNTGARLFLAYATSRSVQPRIWAGPPGPDLICGWLMVWIEST